MRKIGIGSLLFIVFFIFTNTLALAESENDESVILKMYLPGMILRNVVQHADNIEVYTSTGNFVTDFQQAISGVVASRFNLSIVVDRFNEMGYSASVCTQVSYYHLGGGPFDKIIVNGSIYDVMVIEEPPVRWNWAPFSVDNRGQCI